MKSNAQVFYETYMSHSKAIRADEAALPVTLMGLRPPVSPTEWKDVPAIYQQAFAEASRSNRGSRAFEWYMGYLERKVAESPLPQPTFSGVCVTNVELRGRPKWTELPESVREAFNDAAESVSEDA